MRNEKKMELQYRIYLMNKKTNQENHDENESSSIECQLDFQMIRKVIDFDGLNCPSIDNFRCFFMLTFRTSRKSSR
jgi:hypothetical protein